VTPRRLLIQLQSELAQVEAALADEDVAKVEVEGYAPSPEWVRGYWYARLKGLRDSIHEIERLDT